jgi:hypothetical protein
LKCGKFWRGSGVQNERPRGENREALAWGLAHEGWKQLQRNADKTLGLVRGRQLSTVGNPPSEDLIERRIKHSSSREYQD